MQNILQHSIHLAKHWMWLIVMGIVICGSSAYIAAKFTPPTYQATTYFLLTTRTAPSTQENILASLALQPIYSRLITQPEVLAPVVSKYHLTLDQLTAMITVKPQANAQIIAVNVTSSNPRQAMQIANDVAQSFAHYATTRLNSSLQITILPAQQPTTPVQPEPLIDALPGALIGLGLALIVVVLSALLDDHVNSVEEIQQTLGVEVLTTIPTLSLRQKGRKIEDLPALAENCRILSATLNTLRKAKPAKLIMVSSALAGEGKSTVAVNLATFLARSGKHVLLVDADLRHPVLKQHFQMKTQKGLSDAFLTMEGTLSEIELDSQPTDLPSLRLLTAGERTSHPTELLQSAGARRLFQYLRETAEFDYIIFDTAPLLPVADTQILASYIDAAILVGDTSKTPRKMFVRAIHILYKRGIIILGMVLNKSQWPDDRRIRNYLNNLPREDVKLNHATSEIISQRGSNRHDDLAEATTAIMRVFHHPPKGV